MEDDGGSGARRTDKVARASSAHHSGSFEEAWRFIILVGLAAQKYGCAAIRLETFLVGLTNRLGYRGVFRVTPPDILFAVRQGPALPQRVEIVATPDPGVDLDKLARLGDLLNDMKAGSVSLADAPARLDAIDRTPPPWGTVAGMMGYALVALGLAPLLGGGWSDAILATLFSVVVYGIVLISGRLGTVATEWMPLTTAFVAGLLAAAAKAWRPELNVVVVVLSAVAIILPGYTVSLGAGEVVAQRVVSGMTNLMRGLICLAKQISGAWLGVVAGSLLAANPVAAPGSPVDPLWVQVLFPLLLVGLCLAFQISRRDLPWAVLVSGVAYLGILAGTSWLDANLGNLLGTILAVVIANRWARLTGRPAPIVLIPAIVMMVSGTIGFRGLASMAGGELLLGAQQFLQMFVVALTIVAGIMIGHVMVRPEPTL